MKKIKEKPLVLSVLIEYLEGSFMAKLKETFATKGEFNVFRSETNQNFDFLFKQYEKLEQEYIVIKDELKVINPLLEKARSTL